MILGISGKLRVGKDEAAKYLCMKYGFERRAFADALKQLGMEFFGLTYDECFHEKTIKSRDVLQRLGVAFREIDEDVWCRYVLKRVPEGKSIVISDVRFVNEAEMIKQYGGKIIRINRQVQNEYGMHHISETALDAYTGFDVVIDNNDTLLSLYTKLDQVMTSWV